MADKISGMTFKHIKDGKEDVCIMIDHRPFITIHEHGYKTIGMSFEQAQEFAKLMGKLIMQSVNKGDGVKL